MCLGNTPGTKRHVKLTGMVAIKHKRNRNTAIETPIAAAIDSISRFMALCLARLCLCGWENFDFKPSVIIGSRARRVYL